MLIFNFLFLQRMIWSPLPTASVPKAMKPMLPVPLPTHFLFLKEHPFASMKPLPLTHWLRLHSWVSKVVRSAPVSFYQRTEPLKSNRWYSSLPSPPSLHALPSYMKPQWFLPALLSFLERQMFLFECFCAFYFFKNQLAFSAPIKTWPSHEFGNNRWHQQALVPQSGPPNLPSRKKTNRKRRFIFEFFKIVFSFKCFLCLLPQNWMTCFTC